MLSLRVYNMPTVFTITDRVYLGQMVSTDLRLPCPCAKRPHANPPAHLISAPPPLPPLCLVSAPPSPPCASLVPPPGPVCFV